MGISENRTQPMPLVRLSICGLRLVVPARSPARRLLDKLAALLESRNLDTAIREMDRAWRSGAIDHRTLAPVYARLLVRQGRNWGAVIALLSSQPQALATPETHADLALAFLRSGQPEQARQIVEQAFARFVRRPALKAVAREISRAAGFAVAPTDCPREFELDGRATFRGSVINGWVRAGWDPRRPVRLTVQDENGKRVSIRPERELPQGQWGFSIDPRKAGLGGDRFEISATLPDGSRRLLPDAPLLSARAARATLQSLRPKKRTRATTTPAPISIVIPVYRDRERTHACIEAVLSTTQGMIASLIVVDDASPEPDLSADLDVLARQGQITLLRNPSNLGFSASVNRAMAAAGESDVVLINSDVVVFADWLPRLRRAAYSRARIGTVTPLADDDSIAAYFGTKGTEDPVARADMLNGIAAAELEGRTIEVPVGVGFCMYIRRDCWRDTGPFDEAVFAAGYGEEADFCMRARSRRWHHLLAADVFVHHAGGASFGMRRQALLERSGRLLNIRHRGYDALVQRFLKRDPLGWVRRALDEAQMRGAQARFALVVTLALPGGTDRFVQEQSRELRGIGLVPLILRPRNLDDMSECVLECADLGLRGTSYRVPRDLTLLRTLLTSVPIDRVAFQHFLGLDPRVIELVQGLGAPIDTYIHDYSWICPRVTLIDGTDSYCGEPAVSVCEQCIRRNGSNLPEQISVLGLRRRSGGWLRRSRRIIAPTNDTAQRLQRYFPDLAVEAVPHETFVQSRPLARQAVGRRILRVAVIGAIGYHKGYRVLLDCARDAARRKLDLEFVVIGYSEDDERLMRTGKIWITGRYRDSEIQQLLRRESAQIVFLPSVWPETWCYTLSHAIASGLPVVAFDIGAMGERLRAESGGTLLPVGLSPRKINDLLVQIGRPSTGPDTAIFGSNS